ncbi:MAG: large conductance mechanosensitive channel protein MscL [Clostridium sp.]|jgi:large conductance mechanosensitive channel|nr:large conductance mechanosensitive channel protein MscL [Clostridium sp.]
MKKPKRLKKLTGFFGEFKAFVMRGNVIDLAVGVIIGGAFQKIITALVDNIIMPVLSLLLPKDTNIDGLFLALDGKEYADLAAAQAVGAPVMTYGSFIMMVVDFLLMAVVVFCIVKALNSLNGLRKKKDEIVEEPAAPTTQICPYCKTEIHIDATRCPNCTSQLEAQA